MEMMNIKLHTVIRDITGKTGTAIVEAIIKGERNPNQFLQYVDKNIKADHETIAKSLQENWRPEQLYLLEDCYQGYLYYGDRIAACDQAIERQLHAYQKEVFPEVVVDKSARSRKQATKNTPKFNVLQLPAKHTWC